MLEEKETPEWPLPGMLMNLQSIYVVQPLNEWMRRVALG